MRYVLWCLLMVGFIGQAAALEAKSIYGYVEKVTLVAANMSFSAKMDTGAKSASLNAQKIKKVTEGGKTFLEFVVPTSKGEVTMREPLAGFVDIKMRKSEKGPGEAFKRPVVVLAVKIGNQVKMVRVNLADRGHFNYPLLMGRDAIIQFNGVINPAKTYLAGQ